MAELYTVNYTINVKSQQAINALNSFQTATSKLTQAGNKLKTFERQINKTVAQFNKLSKKTPLLDFSTSKANQKLDVIIRKLEKINRLAKQNRTITVNTNPVTKTPGGGAVVGGSGSGKAPRGVSRTFVRPSAARGNYSYKVLGPAMIDTGGIGAIDMLKGMGIAYGITGLGSLMSSAIKDATEYNNLMQTTRNILKTHDPDQATFDARFKEMEQLARYVGISTKFTAPEVADMTKFLAMAGLDINAINHAMNPVANVALIGDTDLGKTADLVTNIMTGYNISPENIGKATDVMTMTFTSANTTLTEIAEAYKYSASLLSAADVSFEESTAALGVLGNAGIKGSQGGTTLRTILANILNPRSKKRADAWEATGVKRFNEDGSLRSLVDIFADLSKLDLDPTAYYKMFDRTAAQGAVSLAAHVDTWNEIIKRNFMSEGIAQELADEKKNTIQGLWYQLTSTFTEQGLRVFEEMDNPVRKFLIDTRQWVNSNDFKTTLRSIADLIMEMLGVFKTFTGILIDVYQKFDGLIKLWLKAQLYLSGLLIPLRIFKSLINFGGLILSASRQVYSLVASFGALRTSIKGCIGLNPGMANMWGQITPPTALSKANERFSVMLRDGRMLNNKGVSSIHAQRYHSLLQSKNFGIGVTSMLGTLGGGLLGSMVGEAGSAANIVATMGGALLGNAMMPQLLNYLGSLASVSGAAAAGILGIVGALGYGAYQWHQHAKRVRAVSDAYDKFIDSTKTIDGINRSDRATFADKYYAIVYDKQISVNKALSDHIALMREQMGILKDAENTLKPAATFKEDHEDKLKSLQDIYQGYITYNKERARHSVVNDPKDPELDVTHRADHPDDDTYLTSIYRFNGIDYWGKGYDERLAVAKTLYSLGRDTGEGSDIQKSIKEFNAQMFRASSLSDFNAVMSNVKSRIQNMRGSIIPGSAQWTIDDVENQNYRLSYHYVTAFEKHLLSQYFGNTPNALLAKSYANLLKDIESNGNISKEAQYAFLTASGLKFFDSTFGEFGSDEFMAKWGYRNGEWGKLSTTRKDEVTGKDVEYELTGDEAREAFEAFYTQVMNTINLLPPNVKSKFNDLINHEVWGKKDKKTGPKITSHNGVDYMYNEKTQMWEPIAGEENGTAVAMTDEEMKKATKQNINPPPSQSQYSQDYKSSTATPKQVIVRIENLMNVESIDMSNPDNVAVIGNLKSQLAQALIDVVHDFDATYQ